MQALAGYYDGDVIRSFERVVAQKNQRVIITILDEFVDSQSEPMKNTSARGVLSSFANPALIEQEQTAWSDTVRNHYEAN